VIYSFFYIDLLGFVCTISGYSDPVKFMCNLMLLEDWCKSSTAVLNDFISEETFPRLFYLLQPCSDSHIVLHSVRNYYHFSVVLCGHVLVLDVSEHVGEDCIWSHYGGRIRGSVVFKAQCYKPEGREFETR
jgi:hypothetical protein